ncbi:MAG: GAF domain-containing protein [Actinobacteria bacterium]|nr:GAF domain-containing protein [Actinomycetota bacterium]
MNSARGAGGSLAEVAGAGSRRRKRKPGAGRREEVRVLLTSTRFVASLFWLTIIVASMLFVLPYSERIASPLFYAFVVVSIVVYLGHRFFPYEGYRPLAFASLLLATDALIAIMVYLTGGSRSALSLLYVTVIIFSSAYFELLENVFFTALTCAAYFAPYFYESLSFEQLKGMAMAVPIYFLIALCGFFVIGKAREQEREKQAISHLFDQADSKRRELSALYAVSLRFASTLNEDEIIDILLENAGALVKSDAMALCILGEDGKLKARAGRGSPTPSSLLADEAGNPLYVSASAVLPVILSDAGEDPRFRDFLQAVGYTSMIAVPLYASASVIGVLACFSRNVDTYDDDAARILLTLASESAIALEKAGLYRTILEDKGKIETIINSLSDGLLVIDEEARVVLANPSIAALLSLDRNHHMMTLQEALAAGGSRVEFHEVSCEDALREVLVKGNNVKSEMVLEKEYTSFFQVLWVPLRDALGGISGAVILFHDVTDFVELDRMKSDFISIVSHELKTPLTSIKGFVRLLDAERVGPVNEKQRHYLEIVAKQTESLTKLINDLLDLSRIEAGIIEVKREAVDLRQVVADVLAQLDNLAQEKGISVRTDFPADPRAVCGDADRLGQVFMNLVHNAIKFTPAGGEVRVEASEQGDHCLVQVSDTGIGISQQDLPKIFNKFYQVDSSSTRQQSGTGLGLSISRELVQAHGGRMWVESRRGKGTTFSFTLPLWDGAAGAEGGGTASARKRAAG